MKRNLRSLTGSLMLFAFGVSYGQSYQPLSVSSGFNQDVIANGVGNATASITSDVDNAGYAFVSNDFQATSSATAPAYGLPAGGLITSAVATTTGLTYQLASLSANNSLKITASGDSGTLVFANQLSATTLYLLATSGSGTSTVNLQINFTDGTSQTVTAASVPDWFNSTALPVAASGFGRINVNTNGLENPSGNPRLYQLSANIDVANQAKLIQSITVTKTAASGALNVFAVSAKVPSNCPELASVSAAVTGNGTANISWALASNGTGGTSTTYTVEVYTDAAYTSAITGSPFTGLTATSQALTGLASDTMYYYRVKANNGVCDSNYGTGSFFSGYCIPTGLTSSTSYYLNNVVTTGGASNISNATGASSTAYANFSSQAVSQIPGGSFNISLNVSSGTNYFYVWVDWNNDMDFSDDGETVVATTSYTSDYSGDITVPLTQAPGTYRMRLASSYIGSISSACGPAAWGEFEDYSITVLTPPSCYFPTGLTATYGLTSSTFNWSAPTVGTTPSGFEYVLTTTEGTPTGNGTATTATSFTADTTMGTTYYLYVRTDCGNGDYSSWSGATFTPNYCVPAINYPGYDNITQVTTTGGYTNIDNSTGVDSGYENYTAMTVSKAAGSSFDISITRDGGYDSVSVFIDWNNNLSFDDAGENPISVAGSWDSDATYNGTIAIPAGTPVGSYRLRVRSYYFDDMTPCGDTNYGETEDYTVVVAEQPANCETPGTPIINTGSITASGVTVTVSPSDASATAPTGYILVRSTAPLNASPVTGTTYAVGAALGGGTVVASGTAAPAFTDFVSGNTQYYYTAYEYNDGGISCFGPVYSESAVASATTCAVATVNSGASNVTNYSANLNWTSVMGNGGLTPTYTVEVYSDAAMSNLLSTYTTTTNSYALTNLQIGTAYYYRVKAETTGCSNNVWSGLVSFTTQSGYTALDVTGFGSDVIANGTGIANLSTTASVDAVDNSYIALDYRNNAAASVTAIGLPVNRRLTNSGITGLEFLLSDYSGNNSLRLPAQNQSGTLTLTSPVKATNLYVAVTSGSGSSTINAQINFTDNTSQAATSVSLLDWYGTATAAQPALISGIGRANRANTVGGVETGASKVFYVTLPVDAANQSKTIASVTFTKTSSGDTEPVPNIFAISAQLVNECPVLNTAFAFTTANSANVSFGLLAGSAAATGYTYNLYTDEAMTTPVAGSPFTTTTTSLQVTGLASSTTYYYSATAYNTSCTSGAVTGSFTTSCETPAAPQASAQSFCGSATVAQLTATAAPGTTLTWYATQGGTALNANAALTTGTYYVTATTGNCVSTATAVQVTVTNVAAPVATAQNFCSGATVADLTATAAQSATITWHETETDEALAATQPLVTGTYYVRATIGSCVSTATAISVTVTTLSAPVAEAQTFCNTATVADLTATAAQGATLSWYATETGEALSSTTVLSTGTYYVNQALGNCSSEKQAVSVTVNVVDAPVAAADQNFTDGDTVAALSVTTADNAIVSWYVMVDGQYVAVETSAALINDNTYYATQTVNGCTSTYTAVTAHYVSATDTFGKNGFVVYPNPANELLNIQSSTVINKVALVNLLGQTVLEQNASSVQLQINLGNVAEGTYILQITSADKTSSVKVIKR